MKFRSLLTGALSVSLVLPVALQSQTKDGIAPVPRDQVKVQPQAVKYQPLNVKTGLWEKTETYKTAGRPPVPAAMLDKLTPEQRARFEARMNASSGGNSRTTTEKSCLTAQQLNNPSDIADKGCSLTILESTTTKASGNIVCRIQGVELTGTAVIEAVDQEHVKGTQHVTSTGGGMNMTTDASFTSKWLGPTCGNVQ